MPSAEGLLRYHSLRHVSNHICVISATCATMCHGPCLIGCLWAINGWPFMCRINELGVGIYRHMGMRVWIACVWDDCLACFTRALASCRYTHAHVWYQSLRSLRSWLVLSSVAAPTQVTPSGRLRRAYTCKRASMRVHASARTKKSPARIAAAGLG